MGEDAAPMLQLEAPNRRRVRTYTVAGPELEPAPSTEERHLKALRTLPVRELLTEHDESVMDGGEIDVAMSDAAEGKSVTSLSLESERQHGSIARTVGLLPMHAQQRLAAAYREADELVKLLALVRQSEHVQCLAREVLPSVHPWHPQPPVLAMHLKRQQLRKAAAALKDGVEDLRSTAARALRVYAESRSLRAHWQLLELTAPSAVVAAATAGARGDSRHTLRLQLCSRLPQLATATKGAASAATAASATAIPTVGGDGDSVGAPRSVELSSDSRGALRLPAGLGSRIDAVRIGFSGSGLRATPTFALAHAPPTSADERSDVEMTSTTTAARARPSTDCTATGAARTHRRLLAAHFSWHSRALFDHLSAEARASHAAVPPTTGASRLALGGWPPAAAPLVSAHTDAMLLGSAYAPSHLAEIAIESMPMPQPTVERESDGNVLPAAGEAPRTEVKAWGLGAVDIGLLSRWHRALRAHSAHQPEPSVPADAAEAVADAAESDRATDAVVDPRAAASQRALEQLAAAATAATGRPINVPIVNATPSGSPAPLPPLLPAVLSAVSLETQQRSLSRLLDQVANKWLDPRLTIHWDLGRAGTLAASVTVGLVCDGRPCAAISAALHAGRVHAQLASTAVLPMASGDDVCVTHSPNAPSLFPVEAVRAVATADDGCGAFAALVHYGVARLLLTRLHDSAASAGLTATIGMKGTKLFLSRPAEEPPPGEREQSSPGSSSYGAARPGSPWMSVGVLPAQLSGLTEADAPARGGDTPVDVRLHACLKEGSTEPRAIAVGTLPGRGELQQLTGLMVRELLLAPSAA